MKYVQATYTVIYKVFTPGEVVRPTSRRCPLEDGEYVVRDYVPPLTPGDDPIVFVEGRRTGVDAYYLTSVSHPCEQPRSLSVEMVGEPAVIASPNTGSDAQQPTAGAESGAGYTPTRGRSGKGLIELGG